METQASTSSSICPFTLTPIGDLPRDNVAVVYRSLPSSSHRRQDQEDSDTEQPNDNECGHMCTLSELVPYLHDVGRASTASCRTPMCPVCLACPIGVVCDVDASSILMQQQHAARTAEDEGSNSAAARVSGANDTKTKEGRIISFRYGTISYHLWVESTSSLQSLSSKHVFDRLAGGIKCNALTRIGTVMRMNVHNGLKIIHKGKIVYSGNNATAHSIDEASEQLLDISTADLLHRRKKPSLTVMGLREPLSSNDCSQVIQSKSNNGCGSMLRFRSVEIILSSSRFILRNVIWCIRWTWNAAFTILGGVYLFVRSVLHPPQMTTD
eukprot:CCRYP_012911-RA/>CCRYP_012911-RA protein AED:0.05 eAED:0.05 QI:208/1/1/1/1/1/2/1186/324